MSAILAMPRRQPYMTSVGLVASWTDIMEAAGLPAVVYKRGLPETDDLANLLTHELVVVRPPLVDLDADAAEEVSGSAPNMMASQKGRP